MAHLTADRVLQAVTPVTTSSFTLGTAITGFRGIAAIPGVANNDTVFYAAWAVDTNGTPTGEWENGLGTYISAVGSLIRTTIISSSNSNNAVTFTGSPVWLSVTLLASKTAYFDKDHAMFMPSASAEPPTPVGGIELYAREILPGHTTLKVMRPSGLDSPIQDGIAFNRIVKASSAGASANVIGGSIAFTAGTAITPSAGSVKNQTQRTQFASGAGANNVTTHTTPAGGCPMFRGSVAGEGGFRYVSRFALNTLVANANFFVGLSDTTTAAAATSPNPLTSITPGRIGLAFVGNTGNFTLMHNVSGTAPTQIALGANFPVDTTSFYELVLFCRPHNGTTAGDITYRIRRYTTDPRAPAFEATGTITTNIPAATTVMGPWGYYGNGGTAAAAQWHFNQLTVESDF